MSRDTYSQEILQTICYGVTYELSFKKIQILERLDKMPSRLSKSFHAIKITLNFEGTHKYPSTKNHAIKNVTCGDCSRIETLKGLFSESVPLV